MELRLKKKNISLYLLALLTISALIFVMARFVYPNLKSDELLAVKESVRLLKASETAEEEEAACRNLSDLLSGFDEEKISLTLNWEIDEDGEEWLWLIFIENDENGEIHDNVSLRYRPIEVENILGILYEKN